MPAKADSTIDGIKLIGKLGLGCMELEFVRGVRMGEKLALQVREIAEQEKVVLTAHGPYYINLNAKEKAKVEASKRYIIETAYIASICNAYSIVFHAGYYLQEDPKKVYVTIKGNIEEIMKKVSTFKDKPFIRTELTGKRSQFGDIDEIIGLSSEIKGVLPCIDFSHNHAREGKSNTYKEFAGLLEKIEKKLGEEALKNMHIHISGIEYTDKGEIRHLDLKDSDLNYKELMKALKDFKTAGVVICESPNLEEDALLLKKEYDKS